MKDLKYYEESAQIAMSEFIKLGRLTGYIYVDQDLCYEFSTKHDYRPQRVCYYYAPEVSLRFVGKTML